MKNTTPLLEDVMRVLYVLQNEGYITRENMEYILEEKYNVSDILYSYNTMACIQNKNKTSITI